MSQSSIHFPLDGELGQDGGQFFYRPWGVRTLKIRMTITAVSALNLPPLRLRVQEMAADHIPGATCGFADTGEAFLVSWGGGHNYGPCVKASDDGHLEGCVKLMTNDTSNIFFNLHHRGPAAPQSAELTLLAYDELTNDIYATTTVKLVKPAIDETQIMRLEQVSDDVWEMGNGRYLPDYDPRWHPLADTPFQQNAPLSLSIRRDGKSLRVYWPGMDEIITIDDKTSPSMLDPKLAPAKYAPGGYHFELLNWSEEFFALRVWFFWLNTNIPFQFRTFSHEVPDAERFDFLIRKKNGKIALACTDLHWREMWGEAEDYPVVGTVGLTLGSIIKITTDVVIPEKFEGDAPLSYDLVLASVELSAKKFAQRDDAKAWDLAPGGQAHVPTLINVTHNPDLVSRDVRTE